MKRPAREILTLPTFSRMTEGDEHRMLDVLSSATA